MTDYRYTRAYREMVLKQKRSLIKDAALKETDAPAGAMSSAPYLAASHDPNNPAGVYVAFKDNRCKRFPTKILRRKFLENNPDWKKLDDITEEINDVADEDNVFWEEVSSLYSISLFDENFDCDVTDMYDLFNEEFDEFTEGKKDDVDESISRTVIHRKDGTSYIRYSTHRKGYAVKKDKYGVPYEALLSGTEVAKRKEAARKRKIRFKQKKYYK